MILSTLNALRILTALKAERLEPPEPNDIYTILILTTNASNIFIISPKNSIPNANIFKKRSMVNANVKIVFNYEYGELSVSTNPFIANMIVFAMTRISIELS